MNVLLINTFDYGGAGKAALRLNQNLKAHGYNTILFVKKKMVTEKEVVQAPGPGLMGHMITAFRQRRRIPKTNPNYRFFNMQEEHIYVSTKRLLEKVPFTTDIIITNWISDFVNTQNLYELTKATKAPVLWYLMDMAPLTGGCHYAWECDGYKNQCGCCPALYSSDPRDISYSNFCQKKRSLDQTDITVVTTTDWLTKQAKASSLFTGKKMVKIMLGIDNEIFKPMDKNVARAMLNLPLHGKILFFGTIDINEERKGGKYLLEALTMLSRTLPTHIKEKVILTTAGQDDVGVMVNLPFQRKSFGIINDDRLLALAYQSADAFVCPSIEDSGPMMINEAIMCGTPVVSFEMGVAPDLVHTGKTGYRAKLRDSQDLARGMSEILTLSEDAYNKMSYNCRELGLNLCHPKVQAESFERLIETALRSSRENPGGDGKQAQM